MQAKKPITVQEFEETVKNIKVLEYLRDLIPPLTEEEKQGLERSILREGIREPLLLWEFNGERILIDGHNRFEIAQKHGIDFNVAVYRSNTFKNLIEVKNWMIANQLGKRNLTETQKSYLRGKQYQAEKKEAHRPAEGEDKLDKMSNLSDAPAQTTAEKLAKQHKVSAKTIQRDEKFAQAIDKISGDDAEVRNNLLNKEVAISKMEITALAEAPEEVRAEAKEAIRAGQKPAPQNKKPREEFTIGKENLRSVNSSEENLTAERVKYLLENRAKMLGLYQEMPVPHAKNMIAIPAMQYYFFRDYIKYLHHAYDSTVSTSRYEAKVSELDQAKYDLENEREGYARIEQENNAFLLKIKRLEKEILTLKKQ